MLRCVDDRRSHGLEARAGARLAGIALVMLALPASVHAAPAAPARHATHAKPAAATARDAEALLASERAITDIVARIQPAVINVRRFVPDEKWWATANANKEKLSGGWKMVPERELLYPHHRPLPGASGVVISDDGYVLTLNRAVVLPNGDEADIIDCEIGPENYKATIVAREPTIDLAILKVTASTKLPFAPLGTIATLDPGRFVLEFGAPDGPVHVLSPGLVTQVPLRECYQDELSATYLQTSMTFDDGALGGPVVDATGKVVGLATRRGDSNAKPAPDGGPGYALPIDLATAIYKSLLERRSRESPWLGISVLRLSHEGRRAAGAPDSIGILVDNVFTPSAADSIGIRVGDVITNMQGEEIRTVYEFQRILYAAGVGQYVSLVLVRKGVRLEKTAHIEKRPPEAITR